MCDAVVLPLISILWQQKRHNSILFFVAFASGPGYAKIDILDILILTVKVFDKPVQRKLVLQNAGRGHLAA